MSTYPRLYIIHNSLTLPFRRLAHEFIMSSSRENIICPDFDLQLMGSEVLEVNSFIIYVPCPFYICYKSNLFKISLVVLEKKLKMF